MYRFIYRTPVDCVLPLTVSSVWLCLIHSSEWPCHPLVCILAWLRHSLDCVLRFTTPFPIHYPPSIIQNLAAFFNSYKLVLHHVVRKNTIMCACTNPLRETKAGSMNAISHQPYQHLKGPSIYLSFYQSIYLYICLCICLYIYLAI